MAAKHSAAKEDSEFPTIQQRHGVTFEFSLFPIGNHSWVPSRLDRKHVRRKRAKLKQPGLRSACRALAHAMEDYDSWGEYMIIDYSLILHDSTTTKGIKRIWHRIWIIWISTP